MMLTAYIAALRARLADHAAREQEKRDEIAAVRARVEQDNAEYFVRLMQRWEN